MRAQGASSAFPGTFLVIYCASRQSRRTRSCRLASNCAPARPGQLADSASDLPRWPGLFLRASRLAADSIDIRVPAYIAYDRLARFEDYPRFIGEVEAVRRLDHTHLHWTTRMANHPLEWDAEITEQEPDLCIAWRGTGGSTNSGRVEVQAVGPDASRVTLTLESAHEQVPASPAGNSGEDAAVRLDPDMARLKDFIEGRGGGEQLESVRPESRSTEPDYSLPQPRRRDRRRTVFGIGRSQPGPAIGYGTACRAAIAGYGHATRWRNVGP